VRLGGRLTRGRFIGTPDNDWKKTMIVVHDFPHGARGLRVAWLCEEMGLAYTMKPVGFPTDHTYRSLNPFGTVPFLQDGKVSMSESVAMLFYIAQKYGPTDTLPSDDDRYAKVLQFTLFGEATLSSPMAPLLAERFGAPNDHKRNWSAVGIESRLKTNIDRLSDQLGDHDFLVGNSVTLADISVATALRIWMKALGQEISPALQRYCERQQERPAYKRALAAHRDGRAGGA
jgi:glutathione S-transferase